MVRYVSRKLRRAGNQVYRAGRDMSLFNGARVGNAAIERLAVVGADDGLPEA
jgi:hypothetical protein